MPVLPRRANGFPSTDLLGEERKPSACKILLYWLRSCKSLRITTCKIGFWLYLALVAPMSMAAHLGKPGCAARIGNEVRVFSKRKTGTESAADLFVFNARWAE